MTTKEWKEFLEELDLQFENDNENPKRKKKFLKLDNKSEHSDRSVWVNGQIFKKFENKQRYYKANLYSAIEEGDVKTLFATAHVICFLNSETIDKEELMLWLVDMNNKRAKVPFTMEVLEQVAKQALRNKDVAPPLKYEYKYLFKKGIKLTHKDKMNIIATDIVETNIKAFHEVLDNWPTDEKYSRSRAAEKIGVKPNTISSWKTRFPDLYADADEKIKNIKMGKKKSILQPIGEDILTHPVIEAVRDHIKDPNHPIHTDEYVRERIGKKSVPCGYNGIASIIISFGEGSYFWIDAVDHVDDKDNPD